MNPLDELLIYRIREALSNQPVVEEKRMFQGLCFMVNNKMCVCINPRELLCRIGKEQAAKEVEKGNCHQMMNNGRLMKDFVFVSLEKIQTLEGLDYWLDLALQFNPMAKVSKKK